MTSMLEESRRAVQNVPSGCVVSVRLKEVRNGYDVLAENKVSLMWGQLLQNTQRRVAGAKCPIMCFSPHFKGTGIESLGAALLVHTQDHVKFSC